MRKSRKIFKSTPFPETPFLEMPQKKKLLRYEGRIFKSEEVDEFDISRRKWLTYVYPSLGESEIDSMIVLFDLKTIL